MKTRIVQDLGNGMVSALPAVRCEDGSVEAYPVKSAMPMQKAQALRMGLEVADNPAAISNQSNNFSNMDKMKYQNGSYINPAETTGGQSTVYRSETAGIEANALSGTINLTIANGEVTAQKIVLGDQGNLIKTALGIPNDGKGAGSVTIGGSNWGADTLDIFNGLPVGYRLHGIHVTNTNTGVESTAFFTGGRLDQVLGSLSNETTKSERLDFSLIVDQNSFNPSIRAWSDFRFIVTPLTGLVFTVPAGETISVTFTLQATGSEYGMIKRGQLGFAG